MSAVEGIMCRTHGAEMTVRIPSDPEMAKEARRHMTAVGMAHAAKNGCQVEPWVDGAIDPALAYPPWVP